MKKILISLLTLLVFFVSGCVSSSSPELETTSSQVEMDDGNLSSCKPHWTDYFSD